MERIPLIIMKQDHITNMLLKERERLFNETVLYKKRHEEFQKSFFEKIAERLGELKLLPENYDAKTWTLELDDGVVYTFPDSERKIDFKIQEALKQDYWNI